jgi:hypothetical protein
VKGRNVKQVMLGKGYQWEKEGNGEGEGEWIWSMYVIYV